MLKRLLVIMGLAVSVALIQPAPASANIFKSAGKLAKKATKAVGGAAKSTAKAVGGAAKTVAKGTGQVAKAAAKGYTKVVTTTAKAGLNAAKTSVKTAGKGITSTGRILKSAARTAGTGALVTAVPAAPAVFAASKLRRELSGQAARERRAQRR